ncbi:MAG TPA: GWxTD domain-containing protein [Thermoanaerobaculia bacterium]|jgi:GWxTD domain-containing protein|nr:GWxTD domain-containing protein [Thermoanaerobaculia bacterium]
MKTLQSFCAVLLLFITCSAIAADPTLPELFKRAKDKFAAGDYKGSLADFELLDKNSSQPGYASDRAKLIPVVTFYRGANLAALGRKNEAKEAFISYLEYVPTAAIASPPFPKATVDVFEQARTESAGRSSTIRTAYLSFTTPPGWSLPADEHWIESPVKYLLTPAQKKEYATFTTNAERASFIEAFWKQLDPTPATDANEFRTEFERRLAFADENLGNPKLAGHLTDRAAVFAFVGPPTYVGVKDLSTGDEAMDQLRSGGMSSTGGHDLEQQGLHGQRESWYYRTGRIPAGVPYREVRFDFMTKQGYGTSVMQKDAEPMQTLGIAADAARRDKKLN